MSSKSDATQRGLECGNDVDQFVGVALGRFDVERVDAGEFFCRTGSLCPPSPVSLAKGPMSPRPNTAVPLVMTPPQVAPCGEFRRHGRIGFDIQTGMGHAR
jgi:hypothetical protein